MREVAPLHPDAQRVIQILTEIDKSGPPPTTIDGMRDFARRRAARLTSDPPEVGRVESLQIPGGGHSIPVRIYHPSGSGGEALPAYIYMHGGGFVVGDLDMVDTACRTVCRDANIVVVSVDYRLAPEHKFPAGLDDTVAAVRWVAQNGRSLGVDTRRLAIGGDSAGGNLAAAASQVLAGDPDVALKFQVLVYPVTDLTCGQASYQDLGTGYTLTAERMQAYIKHYLNVADDARDPRASPLLAPSVADQPPALVVLAGLDPLVDEGRAYADRLAAAGIAVEVHDVPDHTHGFLGWIREAQAAREALSLIGSRLKAALHGR